MILSNEQIRQVAPAVFAHRPSSKLTSRYAFLPTVEVLEDLRSNGFECVKAKQSVSGSDVGTHELRFRHRDHLGGGNGELKLDQETPEVVLVNSHDGSSTYRLYGGVFRKVCSNGMVISTASFGSVMVRHLGNADTRKQILDQTYHVAAHSREVVQQIDAWKQIRLPQATQMQFARLAVILKGNMSIPAEKLLESRRPQDNPGQDGSRDLWTAFNVIQEAVVRGGVQYTSQTGRRLETRPINSVVADVSINQSLWQLATEYATSV